MAMNDAAIDLYVRRLGLGEPGDAALGRCVAVEAPVSVEVGGIAYAVMMATPADLEDYAVGFALGEGLVEAPAEIRRIDTHPIEGGWALRLWLVGERNQAALERARARVSESSCGLCGIENIEEVLRPLPPVTARIATDRAAIAAALAALEAHQPLGRATGAAHAAAFCSPAGDIQLVREDVGRHNALDKLIGALARAGIDPAGGFVLWLGLPQPFDARKLFEPALQRGVCFAPGDVFAPSARYTSCLRLSCGHPWDERIERAVRTLGEMACEMVGQ